ncbi:MAG TPA: tetratricopeptide repeat protein [Bacteroidota bacterium]|nr:tetratricopeptide repeat protein [Bacteroidota bacterium]
MRTRIRRAPRRARGLPCARAVLAWAASAFLAAAPCAARAQSIRSLVNGGNDMYRDQKYGDAEVNYRKALEKEKGLVQGHFNLGDALTKQGKYDEAMREYQEALGKASANDTKAYAWYNIGNSQMKQQKYQDAVQSYIDALKIDPKDDDAKYNLSYALEKLKVPPPKPQQNKKDQDKKDQNKKDQDKKNQQQQDQQNKDQQKKQQPPQQQQKQMSKADAQRILDVLKNSEKDVQKKLHQRQAVRPRTDKDW